MTRLRIIGTVGVMDCGNERKILKYPEVFLHLGKLNLDKNTISQLHGSLKLTVQPKSIKGIIDWLFQLRALCDLRLVWEPVDKTFPLLHPLGEIAQISVRAATFFDHAIHSLLFKFQSSCFEIECCVSNSKKTLLSALLLISFCMMVYLC